MYPRVYTQTSLVTTFTYLVPTQRNGMILARAVCGCRNKNSDAVLHEEPQVILPFHEIYVRRYTLRAPRNQARSSMYTRARALSRRAPKIHGIIPAVSSPRTQASDRLFCFQTCARRALGERKKHRGKGKAASNPAPHRVPFPLLRVFLFNSSLVAFVSLLLIGRKSK